MCSEYLASGFADVDACDDPSAYRHCLTLLDSLPYFRAYKQRSYELLDLSAGLRVLEIGCGLGDDAFRMAERVSPDGIVAGVDASFLMVKEALARSPVAARTIFIQADAGILPFPDRSVDRCRIDRTLQHLSDPKQVIGEMVRVLTPGGLLLAYDNDWGTFAVTGRHDDSTRIIETLWADSFKNRWIGRYLKHYFLTAGLRNVMMEPSVSVITDFALADRVYNLRQTVARTVAAGRLTPAVAEQWVLAAQAMSQSGGFLCTLTAYTVVGTKPGGSRSTIVARTSQ
ncbi:methyltransferase domain-containing protein [uncultured Thiodictyon sp.]|uniref:methyltransferase domain-containing protein n=1 Tax=uncultured Thiodictyon sp. TaxID=1846217 RepID=UPI0025E0D5FB|nr:methyltransferase domain-containing protein [uncultured Thiodictyon sp.]